MSLGLPDALLGSGWPVMHQDLGVPTSYAGIVSMIIAGGTIVSSLLSERLTRFMGTGLLTAVSVAMTAVALFGFSASSEFWMLLLWAVPYGLGAGAVDAALNNYVALHYSSRQMSWLHGCWGVGASLSPFIMGFALARDMGWSSGYMIVGSIQAVLTLALIFSVPLWRKVHPTSPANKNEETDEEQDGRPLSVIAALKIPGVPWMLGAFFAYCSVEAVSFLWTATYFVNQRGASPAAAATYGSLFLIGLTAGRFFSGVIADRVGDRGMIRYGALLMILGTTLVLIPIGGITLPLIGLTIAGLGAAPVYPSIIHATPDNFGRQNSHGIIGIQMAGAYLGSTLTPPIFGFIASAAGMWLFPVFLVGLSLLVLWLSQSLNRVVDTEKARDKA
ncbi:MFS transporter [Actinomycetaceae bacterium MB13-C1-2]|nr:MFS transporter [Actinomycetaceae bacterium MB13-C1-2]